MLTFLDKIPALTGGRDAILTAARELWKPEGVKPKFLAKAATGTILSAIGDTLRAPLTALIDRHVQAVEDEYVLMEGEAPADGDISPSALDWWMGLYEAQEAAAGDATKLLGLEAVRKWVRSDDPAEALAELLIAKPVEDVAHALTACGITQADIEALTAIGAAPPAAAEPAAAPAVKSTRRRAASVEAGPVTEAARVALDVLANHVKDAEMAGALGVSRTQVINYRKGITLFSPNPDQMRALEEMTGLEVARLSNAIGALKSAVDLQEME